MSRSPEKIRADLVGFLRDTYPKMQVSIAPWSKDPARLEIRFIEERFRELYPRQRYHYLMQLIPTDYCDEHLSSTIWVEMAPGEEAGAQVCLDDDIIAEITPDVMSCLSAAGFFSALDDLFSPPDGSTGRDCQGDFLNAKSILSSQGFDESDFPDVFDVLMSQGGFCDCEILYNVGETSRLKADYWRARARDRNSDEPNKRH